VGGVTTMVHNNVQTCFILTCYLSVSDCVGTCGQCGAFEAADLRCRDFVQHDITCGSGRTSLSVVPTSFCLAKNLSVIARNWTNDIFQFTLQCSDCYTAIPLFRIMSCYDFQFLIFFLNSNICTPKPSDMLTVEFSFCSARMLQANRMCMRITALF